MRVVVGSLPSLTLKVGCPVVVFRNRVTVSAVRKLVDSIWKSSHLGIALVVISPTLALPFGEVAVFPVLLTSLLGSAVCLMGNLTSKGVTVRRLRAELLRDLISVDEERRGLVLAELNEGERNWFLAAIRRGEAELRNRPRPSRKTWRSNVRCARRFRYS